MLCAEFEQRVHDLLDLRQRPEADGLLLAHASECGTCRRFLAGQETLLEALELNEPPALAANFAARVLAAVSPTSTVKLRPASWNAWIAIATAAVAAALLLAIGPAFWAGKNPVAPPQIAHVSPVPAPVATAPTPTVTKIDSTSPPVAAEGSLPQVARLKPEEMIRELSKIADDPPVWVNDVAGGFRPVASSLGDFLQVLRQALPGKHDDGHTSKPSADLFRVSEKSPIA